MTTECKQYEQEIPSETEIRRKMKVVKRFTIKSSEEKTKISDLKLEPIKIQLIILFVLLVIVFGFVLHKFTL